MTNYHLLACALSCEKFHQPDFINLIMTGVNLRCKFCACLDKKKFFA